MLDNEEKEEIEADIQELLDEKEKLETQETNESYDDYLDSTKKAWIENYQGGTVFKEIDPTGYRCGLVDYNNPRLCEIENEIDILKGELED